MTFDVTQILSGPMKFGSWSGRDHSGLLGDKASSTLHARAPSLCQIVTPEILKDN